VGLFENSEAEMHIPDVHLGANWALSAFAVVVDRAADDSFELREEV
jgi:hypothetical protein